MVAENVKVVVRVRPQTSSSDTKASPVTVQESLHEVHFKDASSTSTAASNNPTRFTFDGAFSGGAQEDLFKRVGLPVLSNVLEGYNGTILAYGQSGSGKTHTMFGPEGGVPDLLGSGNRGLIPRALEHLFSQLEKRPSSEVEWSVELSVVELYNEELIDLLVKKTNAGGTAHGDSAQSEGAGEVVKSPSITTDGDTTTASTTKQQPLKIREDRSSGGKGIYIENLTSIRIGSSAEGLGVITAAAQRKHMGGTNMNETSSRSHTIVMVRVEQLDHIDHDTKTTSQLFLVDLAGSERVGKTGATGGRLKEAQTINLSLSLLGNVMKKLTDRSALHIPYRDSKLTRLLQDSLGGNSLTTLVCTCSSLSYNASESLSTLQFAQRAKSIKNTPKVNKELSAEELARAFAAAQEEISTLKGKLMALQGIGSLGSGQQQDVSFTSSTDADAVSNEVVTNLRDTVRSLLNEVEVEKDERISLGKEVDSMRVTVTFYAKKNAELEEQLALMTKKYETERELAASWKEKFMAAEAQKSTNVKPPTPPTESKKKQGGGSATKRSSSKCKDATMASKRISFTCRRASSSSKKAGGAAKPEPDEEIDDAIPDDMATPSDKQLMAMVREQNLQTLVDDLKKKLNTSQTALENNESSLATAKVTFEQELDKREELLQKQDKEISSLQLKLDDLRAKMQQNNNTSSSNGDLDEKRELAEMLSRYELENNALHVENRANGTRLLEFTRRIDELQKNLKTSNDEKAKLLRDIESANIDAATKERLLGTQMKKSQELSKFRRRLLECFAVENS